jgi:hypothetical protein
VTARLKRAASKRPECSGVAKFNNFLFVEIRENMRLVAHWSSRL